MSDEDKFAFKVHHEGDKSYVVNTRTGEKVKEIPNEIGFKPPQPTKKYSKIPAWRGGDKYWN